MHPTMTKNYTNPQAIAGQGEQIYKEMYQALYEKLYPHQYVVIDVTTKKSYLGAFSEEAVNKAKSDSPEGIFHLIKVGSPAAFKVSHFYAGRNRSI
jgi:hypothetical protein